MEEKRKKIKERRKGVRGRGEEEEGGKSDVRTGKVGRKSRERKTRKERKAIDRKRRK